MPTSSPWGRVDHQTQLADGIFSVVTAGHGGIMVERDIAMNRLSLPAQNLAEIHNGFYCYEEDVASNVVFFELADTRSSFPFFVNMSNAELDAYFKRKLTSLSQEYMKDCGLELDHNEVKLDLLRKASYDAIESGCGNTIVQVLGETATMRADTVLVRTADDVWHEITKQSYTALFESKESSISMPLDNTIPAPIIELDATEKFDSYVVHLSQVYREKLNDKSIRKEINAKSRFNAMIISTVSDYARLFASSDDLNSRLRSLKPLVDPIFRDCAVFS